LIGTRVTIRYAKALFELAKEKAILDNVEKDLNRIQRVIDVSEKFQMMLVSPVIGADEKRRVLDNLFRKQLHPITFHFLNLLIDKKRENLLPIIINQFMKLLDEDRGILRGKLITAYKFTKTQMRLLKEKLDKITKKNVVLEQVVDPGLLGGFIVRLEDTVIDTSLKNQLVKIRESLISGS